MFVSGVLIQNNCILSSCYVHVCLSLPTSNHAWGSLLSSGSGQSGPGGSLSGSLRISNRGRILLRRRGSNRGLMARWPVIPASEVPDDLVDQAMAVLQGKSREVVIRELQKTVCLVAMLLCCNCVSHVCVCVCC